MQNVKEMYIIFITNSDPTNNKSYCVAVEVLFTR